MLTKEQLNEWKQCCRGAYEIALEDVIKLIEETKAKLLYSKNLSEKECKLIEDFEDMLIKKIKGEKE